MLDTLEAGRPSLRWRDAAAACVVLASGGYPGSYHTGCVINGLASPPADALVFHAGTATRDGQLITAGGRVLNVVGLGPTLDQARERAYAGVSRITFDGMQYRTDIGGRSQATDRRTAVLVSEEAQSHA